MSQYPKMTSITESIPTSRDVDKFGCVLVRDVGGACFVVTLKDENFHNEGGVFIHNEEDLFRSQDDYFESNLVVEWCSPPSRTT